VETRCKERAITLYRATWDIVLEGKWWRDNIGRAVELKHGSEIDPIHAHANLLTWFKLYMNKTYQSANEHDPFTSNILYQMELDYCVCKVEKNW
jgi:hypothetical protein